LFNFIPISVVTRKAMTESPILPVANAYYVGPLPAELEGYVEFAVGGFAGAQPRLRTASASQFYE
jgi:hypothetical protein